MESGRKDDVVIFEELGVDRLYVDEAHAYKNLFLYTKMRNVAGLSTSDAQKSSDMLLKCRYIDELTGGKGVVFATGTPVSNSMTELYTMMRYLQHDTLQQKGLAHFDCWASTFGETTTAIELAPEEANRIGYEFVKRFLKENHAFIVCTHVDKKHIHNHIYWDSTSLDCTRKFRNFWDSTLAVRHLSDLICVEHQRSIVENPRPHGLSYNRWQGDIEKLSNRDRLCFDIDEALAKKPHSFEAFLSLMEQVGYTITVGKNITFGYTRQKRNIRMRSLPEDYREDAIRAVLLGKKIHNPRKRRNPLAEQRAQLVSNLEIKKNQGRGHYYDLSIQNQITKQQAKALLYFQQHGGRSVEDFSSFCESVEVAKKRRDALQAKIVNAEHRMKEIAVLQTHITNYLKTKEVYAGYRKSGYSKKYYAEHADEIELCKQSKKAFDELLPPEEKAKTAGSHKRKLPSLKDLRAEYAELLTRNTTVRNPSIVIF